MGFDNGKLEWQKANIKQTSAVQRVSRGMVGQSHSLALSTSVLSGS